MMDINRFNYELFFIDYYDDELSDNQKKVLFYFLEKHPDLRAEFNAFSAFAIPVVTPSFEGKSNLKINIQSTSNINEENIEDRLIASIENDLSEEEGEELASFLSKNPFYNIDKAFYRKTSLEANSAIVFKGKTALKRQLIIPLWIKRVVAVAAVVIFALILYIPSKETLKYEPRFFEKKGLPYFQTVNKIDGFLNNLVVLEVIPKGEEIFYQEKNKITKKETNTDVSNQNISIDASEKEPETSAKLSNEQLNVENQENQQISKSTNQQINKSTNQHINTSTNQHKSIKAFLANVARKRILKKEGNTSEKLTRIELANISVRTINKIFGTTWNVNATYNQEGEVMEYALNTPNFEFSKPTKK